MTVFFVGLLDVRYISLRRPLPKLERSTPSVDSHPDGCSNDKMFQPSSRVLHRRPSPLTSLDPPERPFVTAVNRKNNKTVLWRPRVPEFESARCRLEVGGFPPNIWPGEIIEF